MKHMIGMITKKVIKDGKRKRSKKYATKKTIGPNHNVEHLICFHNGYWFWFSRPMWIGFTGVSPATLYTREKQLGERPVRQIVGLDKWVAAPRGRPKFSKNIKGKKK